MKKLLLFICTVNLLNVATAQNLLPDSSFEENTSCNFNYSAPGQPLPIPRWFAPTSGTSDYYNACNTSWSSALWVPANAAGYQAANNGNGYVGIFFGNTFGDYKEYISGKLIGCESNDCPLTPGLFYRLSINASLAEGVSNSGHDGFGAYFFTDTLPAHFKVSWDSTLPFTPLVDYSSYGVITDTVNWTTLVDTFQADSAYRYIIIGGVKKIQDMNSVDLKDFTAPGRSSYYYIDKVKLEQVTPLSVKTTRQPIVIISPNPVTNKAFIKIPGQSKAPYSFVLTNTLGQTVQERFNIIEEEIVFNREELPSGVYYYQVHIKDHAVCKGKLILE